jgi:hypothetical protein
MIDTTKAVADAEEGLRIAADAESGGLRPTVAIPLADQDPQAVRDVMKPRLKEDIDKQHEPGLDQLARRLGLH